MSFASIAGLLKEKKLIDDIKKFSLLARLLRQDSKIQIGEYLIQSGTSMYHILSFLTEGRDNIEQVTIPEGATTREVARILEEQHPGFELSEFLHLLDKPGFIRSVGLGDFSPESLEGFLYPETYYFSTHHNTRIILRTLVREFLKNWKNNKCDNLFLTLRADFEYRENIKLTRYDVIILASLLHQRERSAAKWQTKAKDYYRDISNNENKNILPERPLNNPAIEVILATLKPR